MNHQNPAVEWSAFDQKTRSMLRRSSLLCMDATELPASDVKRVDDTLAVKLVVWWVSGIICQRIQPTINLARMDTIQSKMTFGVLDKRPVLDVILGNPFATKRKEAERLIGCRIADLVGFKNALLAPTIKFNEPTRLWNVTNIQTQIEANHRVRNRTLLRLSNS
jgi:hypothetical protein